MAGRARHLPSHLHGRLIEAIASLPAVFTLTDVSACLGPTARRFRSREVVKFLHLLVVHRLLVVSGPPRRFERPLAIPDWLEAVATRLSDDGPSPHGLQSSVS